jgi:FkbM family methyltransferase
MAMSIGSGKSEEKPTRSAFPHVRAAVRRGRREAIVWMGPGRIARLVARHRRLRILRWLSVCAQVFLSAFENEDWDFRRNGEEYLLAAAARVLPGQSLVMDVGAFDGLWARSALRHVADANIHCFEVVGSFGMDLMTLFDGNKRVKVNLFGLWSSQSCMVAHFNPVLPSMTSVVSSVHRYTGNEGLAFEVKLETGDDYCQRHGIERVNYLKIDVEGAEFEVMKGFSRLLRQGNVDLVQFEYGPLTLAAGYSLHDVMVFLAEKGMAVAKIYPRHLEVMDRYYPGLDDFRWGNYVGLSSTMERKLRSAIPLHPRV